MTTRRVKKKIEKVKKFTIWRHFKQYLENSSIHGLKYLVEENRHWTERIFWIITCIAAWLGCLFLIKIAIHNFLNSRSAITIDTNYPLWSVQFPAIHICMTYGIRAKEYAIKTTGLSRTMSNTANRYGTWINFGYDARNPALTVEQYREFMERIMPMCEDIFGVCKYNGNIIDCCKIFMPLKSTQGQCLSFNSLLAPRPENSQIFDFNVKHSDPVAVLTVIINKTEYWRLSYTYFHILITSPITLPTLTETKVAADSISKDRSLIFDINQIPMKTDEGVRSMPMQNRNCRFPHETEGFNTLKVYNYQGCILEKQMRRYKKLCGCLSHVFPPHETYNGCNITGLICGFKNIKEIISVPIDECMVECEETTIDIFKNSNPDESDVPEWSTNKIEFNVLPGPFRRYSRYTVLSNVDFVVAIGSALGLFGGVGILSIVEIFYWLFLR